MKFFIKYLLLSLLAGSSGGNKNSPAPAPVTVHIHFQAVVDDQPMIPGREYRNQAGEPYTVGRLRFYVGRARLIPAAAGGKREGTGGKPETASDKSEAAGDKPEDDDYFLFDTNHAAGPGGPDRADGTSRTNATSGASATDRTGTTWFSLSAAPGRYDSLVFLLGVDSLHNVSGAQTGALDPVRGMFWTWNSGYVMARLEGSSAVSGLPGHRMEYHIGGFKGENSALRIVRLPFPGSGRPDLQPGKTVEIFINADINAWFRGPHPIRISATPACTTPGVLAKEFSENYSNMFTITQLINP